MTKKCIGAKKATIVIFDNKGTKDVNLISTKPPVEYQIKSVSPCWEYGGQGLKSDCSPSGVIFTSQHKGSKPSFENRTIPQGQNFSGCNYSFVILNGKSNYPDFSGGGAPGTTFVRAAKFDDSCDTSLQEAGFKVIIIDSSGIIFTKTYTGKEPPKVDISCDDDCPDGHVRCETNHYPGYCCIPCQATASKIDNLARKVKLYG